MRRLVFPDEAGMAFERMKGVKGLVYVPENTACMKKHPCEDCFSCRMCSDIRCGLCLEGKTGEKPQNEPCVAEVSVRDR